MKKQTMKTLMKQATLKSAFTFGDNAPACPKCGNNNALLGRICAGMGKLTCRDCGHTILPGSDYEKKCFSRTEDGKGVNTLYVENI